MIGRDANFTTATLGYTIFALTDLTSAEHLDTCTHNLPSTIDFWTLDQSRPLPIVFLRDLRTTGGTDPISRIGPESRE